MTVRRFLSNSIQPDSLDGPVESQKLNVSWDSCSTFKLDLKYTVHRLFVSPSHGWRNGKRRAHMHPDHMLYFPPLPLPSVNFRKPGGKGGETALWIAMDPGAGSVLPKLGELSPQQLAFLDKHLRRWEDLSAVPGLCAELSRSCSDLDGSLVNLRRHLTKLAVSWIYRSVGARSSIQKLSFKLEDLSLCSSQSE